MFRIIFMTAAILAAIATESSAISIVEASTGKASLFAQVSNLSDVVAGRPDPNKVEGEDYKSYCRRQKAHLLKHC